MSSELEVWLLGDDTGRSSVYLASALRGYAPRDTSRRPYDADDFGRCVRLVDAVPEFRHLLHLLAEPEHGPVWNAIGARWADLEALYRAEKFADLTAELRALAAKAVEA